MSYNIKMNKKKFNIYLLELTLPGGTEDLQRKMNLKPIKIDGDETLLDADIVIVDPSGIPRLWSDASINYRGEFQPRVDQGSQKIYDNLKRRRDEIEELLKQRKIVIILSSKKEIANLQGVENGVISEVIHPDEFIYRISNYDFFPIDLSFIKKKLGNGLVSCHP